MASLMDSMFSPTSSTLDFDTSFLPIPENQANTLVILLPIVFPTPPTLAPHLLIMTQLTKHAYNLPEIITWRGILVLSSSSSLIVFFIISQTTLYLFVTHPMLLGCNQTQTSSIRFFIAFNIASPTLLCTSR